MFTNSTTLSKDELKKEKIRERYKGIDADVLEVIPAIQKENFYEDTTEKRVAVYARVSTGNAAQTSSYELQRNHYLDSVSRHPGWNLVHIYADEGISGTSMKNRIEFNNMIKACESGELDLIVTKSVSRFARNVVECINTVRELAALTPPVGVFFETENLYTLDSRSEMALSFISVLAQEESHIKSDVMNASYDMRYKQGIFLTPPFLGFDQDENGDLVINETEAKTVRLIFFLYLYGYSSQQIADTLTKLKCRTKKGNTTWSAGSILYILQNERTCGELLARKTFTPNYLDHKSKKNRQNKPQYRHPNHHEPIITRDDFLAVQKMIANAKYGSTNFLPELQVVKEGILKGFVSINPRWSSFSVEDYYRASASVMKDINDFSGKIEVKANTGDFDLRGFEVVRGHFFDTGNKVRLTFAAKKLNFTKTCFPKLPETLYVELLINPYLKLLAVRACTKDTKNAMQWAKLNDGKYCPRSVAGSAYLPTLFKILGWDMNCKYRIIGNKKQKDAEVILLFNLQEPEILVPGDTIPIATDSNTQETSANYTDVDPFTTGTSKDILAYPFDWAYHFGNNYYRHNNLPDVLIFKDIESWNAYMDGNAYQEPELNVTEGEELKNNISSLMKEVRKAEKENE